MLLVYVVLHLDDVEDHFGQLDQSLVLVQLENLHQLVEGYIQVVDLPQIQYSRIDYRVLDEVLDDRDSHLELAYGVGKVEGQGHLCLYI